MKDELTRADRVAQADLTHAILSGILAKNKMEEAEKERQRANNELVTVEARFSMGRFSKYRRQWQNPFYLLSWKTFWYYIIWS